MAYKNIYGTGGIAFRDLINQGQYIYFPTAIATIDKKKIEKVITGNKGKIKRKHKGWRLNHTVVIQNFCEDDYINILALLENISYMTSQTGLDKSIYFFPKVSDNYVGFDQDFKNYRVLADGMSIKFSKIADTLSQGEYCTLNFTTIGLETDLSYYASVGLDGLVTNDGTIVIDNNESQFIIVSEGD